MHDKLNCYKEKLEAEILDCINMPLSERSASHADSFMHYWMTVCKMQEMMYSQHSALTEQEADCWNAHMQNEDGTTGGKWPIYQTTACASKIGVKFDHITDWAWNVAMNMIYSDYCRIASDYALPCPEFYAVMAKAFLFDKDGGDPMKKLGAYYCCIVAPNIKK